MKIEYATVVDADHREKLAISGTRLQCTPAIPASTRVDSLHNGSYDTHPQFPISTVGKVPTLALKDHPCTHRPEYGRTPSESSSLCSVEVPAFHRHGKLVAPLEPLYGDLETPTIGALVRAAKAWLHHCSHHVRGAVRVGSGVSRLKDSQRRVNEKKRKASVLHFYDTLILPHFVLRGRLVRFSVVFHTVELACLDC